MEGLGFHQKIAEECLKQYSLLPSRGKPIKGKEWTPLAGVVLSNVKAELKVVALGTGSKCIGANSLDLQGWRVRDSHAEVLARRAFRRYLLYQVKAAIKGAESIFEQSTNGVQFNLVSGTSFHLFSSHVPCGDASIFPNNRLVPTNTTISDRKRHREDINEQHTNSTTTIKQDDVTITTEQDDSSIPPQPKRFQDCNPEQEELSFVTLIPDVHRTGAKCVVGGASDPKLPGSGYHVIGVLRTKPGRGDPTHSMSCSDKIMKWNYLGCQGALLSHYLSTPVYFSTITIGGAEFNEDAVKRALLTRLNGCEVCNIYSVNQPIIRHVAVENRWEIEEGGDRKPSHMASSWCLDPETYEVVVAGLKQGANSKSIPKEGSNITLCKRSFFSEFIGLLEATPTKILPSNLCHVDIANWKYEELKSTCIAYQMAKMNFIKRFPSWVGNKELPLGF